MSLEEGGAREAVVLVSTLITYTSEKSSGMNANSCWTPESWKKDVAWPWEAGKVAPE